MNRDPYLPYLKAIMNEDPPDDPPPDPPPDPNNDDGGIPGNTPSQKVCDLAVVGQGVSASCGSNGQSYTVNIRAKTFEVRRVTVPQFASHCNNTMGLFFDGVRYGGEQYAFLEGTISVVRTNCTP